MSTEKIDIVEFRPSDERAWMVSCPPTDECDYRVYFTHADAECADETFRDDCLTEEDDAARRTQGVTGLVSAAEANARITTLRSQVAALTAERDAMVKACEAADVLAEAMQYDMPNRYRDYKKHRAAANCSAIPNGSAALNPKQGAGEA